MFDFHRLERVTTTIKPLHELYIEISTRKLAIPFDEYDSVLDIHASWYKFFEATRQSLKDINAKYIKTDGEQVLQVIKLISSVLELIRSHLKKYYKNFGYYMSNFDRNNVDYFESEKSYPYYDEIVADIKAKKEVLFKLKDNLELFLYKWDEV